jgi:WD40 repeat protein
VALSADRRLLASCSWDGTIRLWETEGWRPLHTLQGHTGPVYVIAISAGGRLLASGGEDGTVRLWNATNGQLLTTLEGHTDGVRGVALSADGRLVASGSWDGTIRLWEPPLASIQRRADSGDSGGRLLSTLHGHTSGVWGVALSADGGLLASGSFDGTIRLWQTSSGTCQRTLRNNRRYERMNITGLTGVTEAHRAALLALGAVEQRPYGEAPVEVTSESAL